MVPCSGSNSPAWLLQHGVGSSWVRRSWVTRCQELSSVTKCQVCSATAKYRACTGSIQAWPCLDNYLSLTLKHRQHKLRKLLRLLRLLKLLKPHKLRKLHKQHTQPKQRRWPPCLDTWLACSGPPWQHSLDRSLL